MLFLLLTTLCAATIMIAMRMSGGHIRGRSSLLAVNYAVCALLSWGNMGFGSPIPAGAGAATAVWLGLLGGLTYVVSLGLSQYNIPRNGVVLSSVASRVGGLVVPLGLAVLLFGEFPRPVQVVGAVLALVSIVVLNYDKDHMSAEALLPLAALFVADGCSTSMAKIFRELGDPAHSAHFLLFTFGTAFALCVAIALLRRERPGFQELLYGVMVGVPNFFASRFLIDALETVPAVVVYPVRGVGAISLVALAGVACFGERLRRHQWCAMAAVTVAIVLLSL